MPWATIANFFVNILTKIGLAFLIRKGGRDDERADTAEKTVETIERVTAPVSIDERERLWSENAAKFGGGVRRDPGS